VTLPWTESFADFPGGAPAVDSEELDVLVGGKRCVAQLRGLVPGSHQIGLRVAWPGPGVLVVRPVNGGEPVLRGRRADRALGAGERWLWVVDLQAAADSGSDGAEVAFI
jgi:hypothetical protein